MKKSLEWSTVKRSPDSLKKLDYNPRHLSTEQKEQLRESLQRFGYVEVAAINLDGTIIAGHQRIGLLIELGLGDKPVDVRIPNRLLTVKEVREYNIRSNKNAGTFDESLLATHFQPDELAAWGFSEVELNELFEAFTDRQVKEEPLRPYKRTHVLISFAPGLWGPVEKHLQEIQKITGVEVETSSN